MDALSHRSSLALDLRATLEICTLGRKEVALREACLGQLRILVESLGPEWRLRPFGSFASGFASMGCDLDVTCCYSSTHAVGPRNAGRDLKELLLPKLNEHRQFEMVQEIFGARIPILKLKFADAVEVDLSCHNVKAVENSNLLQAYAALNPLIRDLVILVKRWAKAENVLGASDSHLSSYSYSLLALYYLQCSHGMPFLKPAAFGLDNAHEHVRRWFCPLDLADLLLGFFRFYTRDFRWGDEVVSIRLGQRRSSTDFAFGRLHGRGIRRLHVEDPYLLGRNLHVTLGLDQEQELRQRLAFITPLGLGGKLLRSVGLEAPPSQDKGRDEDEGSTTSYESSGGHRGESDSEVSNVAAPALPPTLDCAAPVPGAEWSERPCSAAELWLGPEPGAAAAAPTIQFQ